MKSNTRGQAAGPRIWPGVVIVVIVTVFMVGQTILDAMSAQLPSGDVVLCGGACGLAWNLIPVAMVLIIISAVAILLKTGVMGRLSS